MTTDTGQPSARTYAVVMPPLGDGSGDLVLEAWLCEVGDEVHRGEPLFSVGTDKTSVVVEALATGILADVLVQPGETAIEGQVIARIAVATPAADGNAP
jgi:pyruvate/2-oxoglutarate dehydrogenase complex dihydrolipoamide acyltransferase (E2) component